MTRRNIYTLHLITGHQQTYFMFRHTVEMTVKSFSHLISILYLLLTLTKILFKLTYTQDTAELDTYRNV